MDKDRELLKIVRRIKKLFADDPRGPDGCRAANFTLGVHYLGMRRAQGIDFDLDKMSRQEIYRDPDINLFLGSLRKDLGAD